MEIYDVVVKLIGEIDPIGDSGIDEKRYKNLVEMTKLIDKLLYDIDRVIPNKNRQEDSMKKAGLFADGFFESLGIAE